QSRLSPSAAGGAGNPAGGIVGELLSVPVLAGGGEAKERLAHGRRSMRSCVDPFPRAPPGKRRHFYRGRLRDWREEHATAKDSQITRGAFDWPKAAGSRPVSNRNRGPQSERRIH